MSTEKAILLKAIAVIVLLEGKCGNQPEIDELKCMVLDALELVSASANSEEVKP